jgi:serine/threonine-protein kinase
MSPPNVLITKYGEIKIVDFGLAKATSQLEKSEAGIIKGKFSYLSPEAAQGIEVDHRADIFAVGIILWEMLSGRRLFLGDTDFQTVTMVQKAEVAPLSSINGKATPPQLDKMLARALARDREQRYASARDLGRDLWDFLYKYGRNVSAFDIAEIVRGAMTMRKPRTATTQSSLIDKLIEEALLEFTSLQDKEEPIAVSPDEPAKLPDFYDISQWADQINVPSALEPEEDAVRKTLSAVEAGNLAALEEDPSLLQPIEPAPSAGEGPISPPSAAPSKRLPVPAEPNGAAENVRPATKGGGGTVKALLLVAALAILAAGAWFGGLIPR